MSKNQHRVIAGGKPDSRISSLVRIQNGRRCLRLPMVGVAGFEPATLRLSSACSKPTELHARWLVEAWGFEPQTYSLQSYRSTN